MLKSAIATLLLFLPFHSWEQTVTDRIKLNQVGFYTFGPKSAVVTGEVTADTFYVTTTNLRDTVFKGPLSREMQSQYSSTKTRQADFSAVHHSGSFVIAIPGVGTSYVFSISPDVFKEAGKAVLKGFYFQRVSMPLLPQFAGKWHRSAGHPDTAVLIHPSAASSHFPAGTVISSPGGWYDAGDYNKYIVNSGLTMGTLLSAYEDFSSYFDLLNTNIPESNDAVPDILNEALYNLRWMLTMQDPYDGGVYHKCTNAAFDGMVMPGVTQAPRYVVQKGTAATLDFAAVTAQSYRIFKKFNKQFPGLADSCLRAAKKAWEWSLVNPHVAYNQYELNQKYTPKITTGDYGDHKFNDEWLWAASELFISSHEKKYFDTVENHMKDPVTLPSWPNVGMMGYYSFLRLEKTLPSYTKNVLNTMRKKILTMADDYVSHVSSNAFGTVMGRTRGDFSWGGNSIAANQGILLIRAYLLTANKMYADNALTNMDYILGKNATGYCFITGVGSKSPMHPHHRQSVADGVVDPVPGLMVGGPNPGMQDHCHYEFTEPETAYVDSSCAYASNEIAINWNAPVAYLVNAFEAINFGKSK